MRNFLHAIAHDETAFVPSSGMGETIARYWRALRPPFFTASILPVLAGAAWGASQTGRLDWISSALFLFGMLCGHGAGNVMNDVCDDISGNDRANDGRISPFTGGSRMLQDGLMSRRGMSFYAFALLWACAAAGMVLIARHGWSVLGFGLGMAAVLFAYHLPPLKLNYRGFAEVLVGIMFGVAPLAFAAWLQGAPVNGTTFLVALPLSIWIANVLIVNEVPDLVSDKAAGKHTLVVAIGPKNALRVQAGLSASALALLAFLSADGVLPLWAGLVPAAVTFAALPAVLRADPDDRAKMTSAIKATLALHAVGGAALIVALASA